MHVFDLSYDRKTHMHFQGRGYRGTIDRRVVIIWREILPCADATEAKQNL